MAELIQMEIKTLPDVLVVGKPLTVNMKEMQEKGNPIPAFWDKCFADGTYKLLETQADKLYDPSYVGWMSDWHENDGNFTYMCGMLTKPDFVVPEGYVARAIESGFVAVGWIKGAEKETYGVAHELTNAAIEQAGYTAQGSACCWCMELYNCPRFTQPDAEGKIILDYYIPCVKTGTVEGGR